MRSRLAEKGGLTDTSIDNITWHYGQTIQSFPREGSVELLRQCILAIYAHARSTEAVSRHQSCPFRSRLMVLGEACLGRG